MNNEIKYLNSHLGNVYWQIISDQNIPYIVGNSHLGKIYIEFDNKKSYGVFLGPGLNRRKNSIEEVVIWIREYVEEYTTRIQNQFKESNKT